MDPQAWKQVTKSPAALKSNSQSFTLGFCSFQARSDAISGRNAEEGKVGRLRPCHDGRADGPLCRLDGTRILHQEIHRLHTICSAANPCSHGQTQHKKISPKQCNSIVRLYF